MSSAPTRPCTASGATRKHELRVVPWERVVGLRETWTPWPVETETLDTAQSARNE